MPHRLDATAPGFEAGFTALLESKRETDEDVGAGEVKIEAITAVGLSRPFIVVIAHTALSKLSRLCGQSFAQPLRSRSV